VRFAAILGRWRGRETDLRARGRRVVSRHDSVGSRRARLALGRVGVAQRGGGVAARSFQSGSNFCIRNFGEFLGKL
jgi:hypothetical protein